MVRLDDMNKKVGRNDPCPCGSGKKYKKCCLNKQYVDEKALISDVLLKCGCSSEIVDVVLNGYEMVAVRYKGACHMLSSILYVALSELGCQPVLCIGEIALPRRNMRCADHSWIELDGKILDLALCNPLEGEPVVGPVVYGVDVITNLPPEVEYGVYCTGLGMMAEDVCYMSFVDYMDKYPNSKHGLWDFVNQVCNAEFDIDYLRQKYRNTVRTYVRL